MRRIGPDGAGLAERRAAAARGLPRRLRRPAPRRRRARGALADRAAALAARRASHATRSQPTTPTCRRPSRPRSGPCCSPTPIRRCATRRALRPSHGELARSVAGVGGSAGSAGRSTATAWPSCSAARASRARQGRDLAGRRLPELLAALAIAATHVSQLAQDFEIFASHEFAAVELADRQPGQRADAAEAQPLRPGRHPHPAGKAAGDRPRPWCRSTPARRAPTTSTC